MNKEKILVCLHKKVEIPNNSCFFPIQVGCELSNENFGIARDNDGENISSKNSNYCELTAQYWAWKNLKGIDIIGLNHYRRFFDFANKHPQFSPELNFADYKSFLNNYKIPKLSKLLANADIVLPSKSCHPYSNSTCYCRCHLEEDWNILRHIVKKLFPDYYSSFIKAMDHNNEMSDFNMFITKWDIFDRYNEWLFKLLFEVENQIKFSPYPNQMRVLGFMSERLINVFCEKENLKIKHIPVVMPLENFSKNLNTSNSSFIFRKIRYKIAYKIAY